MGMTKFALFAMPMSAYATKVLLAARWKGVTLDVIAPPDGYRSPAYRAIVPQGSVPALMHDGFTLAESDTIIEYLDEIGAGVPLLPTDPQARARNRELARFVDLRLELAARALYPHVGAAAPDDLVARLRDGCTALGALVRPEPWLTGVAPSLADCALLPVANILDMMGRYLPADLALPDWLGPYRLMALADPGTARLLGAHRDALEVWAESRQRGLS